jgi:hypothetical protein
VDVKLIPDCGHAPHFQAKDTVLAEMTRFIKMLIPWPGVAETIYE